MSLQVRLEVPEVEKSLEPCQAVVTVSRLVVEAHMAQVREPVEKPAEVREHRYLASWEAECLV